MSLDLAQLNVLGWIQTGYGKQHEWQSKVENKKKMVSQSCEDAFYQNI